MSRIPHYVHLRNGTKYGDVNLIDGWKMDLTDPFSNKLMGDITEIYTKKLGFTR